MTKEDQVQNLLGSRETVIRGYRKSSRPSSEVVYFCLLQPYISGSSDRYCLMVCEFVTYGGENATMSAYLENESFENVEPIIAAFDKHSGFYQAKQVILSTDTQTKAFSKEILEENSIRDSSWLIDYGIVLAAFATFPNSVRETTAFQFLLIKMMDYIR